MPTDQELLRAYGREGGEAAFEELVRRYVDGVYGTACRWVRDPHLAEDVTQSVFLALARNPSAAEARASLAGWLHRTCRNIASQTVRTEVRRRTREEESVRLEEPGGAGTSDPDDWLQVESHLDAALLELGEMDREALLLRFFGGRSMRDVGLALGASEEAAQKRVQRAMERLRGVLAARGVAVGVHGLASGLAAHAVSPAPALLVAAINTAASSSGIVGAGPGLAATLATMSTIQKCAVAILVIASLGTALFQWDAKRDLRAEVERLQTQQRQMEASLADHLVDLEGKRVELDARARLVAEARAQHTELLRLRGEVGVLKEQKRQLTRRLADRSTLPVERAQTPAPPPAAPSASSPFQLRLVADAAAEGTESMSLEGPAGATEAEGLTVEKSPMLDAAGVASAQAVTDPASGAVQIDVVLTDAGRDAFARLTREHLHRRIAIALDGRIYAAPVIRSEITGGRLTVSGQFTEEEAWVLAARINHALQGLPPEP